MKLLSGGTSLYVLPWPTLTYILAVCEVFAFYNRRIEEVTPASINPRKTEGTMFLCKYVSIYNDNDRFCRHSCWMCSPFANVRSAEKLPTEVRLMPTVRDKLEKQGPQTFVDCLTLENGSASQPLCFLVMWQLLMRVLKHPLPDSDWT